MITTILPLRAERESIATPGGNRLRAVGRLAGFLGFTVLAALEWFLFICLAGRRSRLDYRAAWLQRLSQRLTVLLGLRVEYRAEPPRGGLLVCNHLSYLDVIVLAAKQPLLFVAKREVRSWPGLGPLVACAGTIFIDREQRGDVVRVGEKIRAAIAAGVIVCVFAEGTSSDGAAVLPFCSSLFAPAVAQAWPVTPAWLGYTLEHGSVADEVCYWRDMVFFPHFLNLLAKPRIGAQVRYGITKSAGGPRKTLAGELRQAVAQLGTQP